MNPVFTQLIRRNAITRRTGIPLSVPICLGLGIALVVVEGGNFQSIESGPLDIPLFIITWVIVLLMPIAVAMTAADLTIEHVTSDLFTLLHVTPITNSSIVKAYFLATLYFLRRLLTFLGCTLMPVIAATMLRNNVLANADCSDNLMPYVQCSSTDWVGLLFISASLIAGLIGLYLMSASIGVATGIWVRHRILSGFIAAFVNEISVLPIVGEMFYLYSPQVLDSAPAYRHLVYRDVVPFALLSMGLPYLVAVAALIVATYRLRYWRMK